MTEPAPFCTQGRVALPHTYPVSVTGPMPCPALPLGPYMWVMTIEPLPFPGWRMAGKCSRLDFPASPARHVEHRSIVPGNNGPWKCAGQGCEGLLRKPLLTFSLGEEVLGKCLQSPSWPIPLRSAAVRRRHWVSSGSGQIMVDASQVCLLWAPHQVPPLVCGGMLTASQAS